MRRAPVIDTIAPRVGPRLDRAEEVGATVVGNAAPATAEVRIQRRDVMVIDMAIPAPGIRLPDFDQRTANRPRIVVENATMDDDPLTDRIVVNSRIVQKIVVERVQVLMTA